MRYSSMFLALLLAPLAIPAHAQAGSSYPLYVRPPASQSCPVGLSATREPGGPLHSTGSSRSFQSQGIRIHLASPANGVIVKADIVVHGTKLAGHEGLLLTGRPSIQRDSSESYQLVGTAAEPLLHPLISTSNMTAISWLELTRIEYADGNVWSASNQSRCTVAPNLYMLVDSAKR